MMKALISFFFFIIASCKPSLGSQSCSASTMLWGQKVVAVVTIGGFLLTLMTTEHQYTTHAAAEAAFVLTTNRQRGFGKNRQFQRENNHPLYAIARSETECTASGTAPLPTDVESKPKTMPVHEGAHFRFVEDTNAKSVGMNDGEGRTRNNEFATIIDSNRDSKQSSRRDALRSIALISVSAATTSWTSKPSIATAVESSSVATSCSVSSSSELLTTMSLPATKQQQQQQQRFLTVDDVPSNYFDERRSIYGLVERIIDGDTIRVRHIPGYNAYFSSIPQPLKQRGIANDTLSVRFYAVDCPEVGKNKRQSTQPFGEEAKQFTSDLVFHKMVKITFLRRDQYKRAVAIVETVPGGGLFGALCCSWIPGMGPKDLTVELARNGFAELYTGGGAEYGGKLKVLQDKIALAKREKRGIWSIENRLTAAEFKRQQKQQQLQQQQ